VSAGRGKVAVIFSITRPKSGGYGTPPPLQKVGGTRTPRKLRLCLSVLAGFHNSCSSQPRNWAFR